MKRTLRVHLSTTAFDQSWQLGNSLKNVPAPPESDAPGTGPVSAQQAADEAATTKANDEANIEVGDAATVKPDFSTDKGVPRFELEVTGEVLDVRHRLIPTRAREQRAHPSLPPPSSPRRRPGSRSLPT